MTLRRLTKYAYLVPALSLLILFMYYPVVSNIFYSFLKWDLFKGTKTFIGFRNYLNLFSDETFWVAVLNNLKYIIISLIFQVGVALFFAAQIEQFKKTYVASFFRAVLFIPSLISFTIIGLLFSFVFKTDGLLNSLISLCMNSPFRKGWLGDPKTAIYAIIGISQWKGIGYTMMLLCVAIQRIPVELYEASTIDGASKISMFRNVTVPLITDMIKISLIINISGGLLVFNEVFVMTNGGPHGSSEVLSTIMYKNAFVHGKVGYASAISIVILLMSIFFYALQQLVFKEKES